mmetsp:Transcript_11912/g.27817  ORF Transcript_11912/g.27817 Transcript_11912/m.27817 type:complete len:797 (-) Transcript_11912:823-3213(-)
MAGIMAASVPRQDLPTGWKGDPQSSVESNPTPATSGLEVGMAGLNLISVPNNSGGSIKSRSPIPNSGDSVHSTHSTGTANSNQAESFASSGSNMNRPPGIAGFSVPPIGKPGHTKTSSNSSTAHTAALTPTSSVDGGASNDLYIGVGGGRSQHSPSSGDHLPGIGNLGSFDTDDGAHDGLMGLQALRERAQSSPGPTPREFSVNARGFVPGRPRLPSKDSIRSISLGSSRPPLAGGSAISPHTVDGMGFQSTGNRSRGASPPPNAGVISRPDSQFLGYANANDSLDSITLRRALSNESFGADYNNYGGPRQGSDHLNNSFNQVSLNNSQRGGSSGQFPGLYQSQPQRTLSAGPDYYHEANYEAGFIPHRANANLDSEYGMQQHHPDMGYHQHGPSGHQQQFQQPRGPHRRSMSLQHSSYSDNDLMGQSGQGMYGTHHRRGSMGPLDGQMQRRASEFGGDSGMYDQRERLGNTSYHRQDNRMVSPAHSPMHSSYGSNHNRYPSDLSSASSASPSMGLGSAPLYGRHRLAHSDEDLSHPLAGENIEVPGEDQYYNEGMPYQRSQSMGHASSYGADSRHLPTAGASMQAPRIVYNVKFKRTQRTFEIGPRLNRHLEVGTYVKVEADRGEDLGIVIGKVKNPIARSASFGGGMGDMPTAGAGGGGDLKKIIRLATHDEVQLLGMKRKEEEELLEVCRHKVIQRGMPMVVVDAEYQFDRHKLTFFFEANTRIDFRELVRDLFSIYKTRIWMQQLDKSTSATCPTAPAPAPLVMDYGTPIIAPVSEYEGYAQTSGGSDDSKE